MLIDHTDLFSSLSDHYCPKISLLCTVYGFSSSSYEVSEDGRTTVTFAATVKGMTDFIESVEGRITSRVGGTASKLLLTPILFTENVNSHRIVHQAQHVPTLPCTERSWAPTSKAHLVLSPCKVKHFLCMAGYIAKAHPKRNLKSSMKFSSHNTNLTVLRQKNAHIISTHKVLKTAAVYIKTLESDTPNLLYYIFGFLSL